MKLVDAGVTVRLFLFDGTLEIPFSCTLLEILQKKKEIKKCQKQTSQCRIVLGQTLYS